MEFTIREEANTKCASCVHAFRVKPYSSPTTLTICRLLNSPVGRIEKCNYHVTLSQTGPPPHMLMDAWMIDVKKSKSGRVVGFRAQEPPTVREIQLEALKDIETEKEIVTDVEQTTGDDVI